MERMNYINRPKPAYTQEERIKYLEESIRELRKEKENLRKEKGELKARLEEENKRLQSENDKQKTELAFYKQSKIIDNETLQIRQKEKMRYKEILDRIKELYEDEEEAELLNYLDEILDEI